MLCGSFDLSFSHTEEWGGGNKIFILSRGGGERKVSDMRFTHIYAPPPPHTHTLLIIMRRLLPLGLKTPKTP